MKKYFYLLLAATLFAGCSDDNDDETIQPGTETEQPGDNTSQPVAEWDYASCLGMNLVQAIGKFGENPLLDMGTMKMYAYESGKVENVMLVFNDSEQLYMITASLYENAATADELKAYFGSRYTLLSEDSGTYTLGDDEEDAGNAEEVAYCTLSYANNADVAQATVTVDVMVDGASITIAYMNPQLLSVVEDDPATIRMDAFALVEEFMGRSIDDVLDEYDGLFMTINGTFYGANVTDDYVSYVGLFVVDGQVDQVRLMCEDATVEEIIAFYGENGYEATELEPIVDEETGEAYQHYEFRNIEAGYVVDYVDGIATFSRI